MQLGADSTQIRSVTLRSFQISFMKESDMQSATMASSMLNTRRIVITGVLAAVAILLGITRLGFIPVPNVSGNATIMHVPAIVGGALEGPVVGAIVGGIFGIFAFIEAQVPFFR